MHFIIPGNPHEIEQVKAYLSGVRVEDNGVNAKEWYSCGTWFCLDRTRERGNDDASRLGLPEGVDDGTLAASDVLVVPVPSLWVDRLADSTKNPQGAQVVVLYMMRAKATQEADGCWRGVELRQLVLLDSLPVTRRRGVDRGRLKDGGRNAVCEWTINDVTRGQVRQLMGEEGEARKYVRVSGDPTNIGHASKPVIRMEVEDVFHGQGCTKQISTCRVHHTLRLASRAGCLGKNCSDSD